MKMEQLSLVGSLSYIEELKVIFSKICYISFSEIVFVLEISNGIARTLKKLCTSKRDYWIKQSIPSIASLFIIGTSLKGKNLLPN